MEEGGLSGLATLALLITLHALIALAYAALTNSRETHLRELTENESAVSPRLHITYQISLIILQFSIAALTASSLAQPVITALDDTDPATARMLAYVIVLAPTALVTFVLGLLVPEAVGSARADRIAPWALYPMRLLIFALNPLAQLMLAISRLLASAFGSSSMVNVFTEEEIMTLLDAGQKEGTIENEEKEMIFSVLQLDDTLAREVMVPRIDIVAVDIETPLHEALQVFIESGHSRIPVYEDNIDNIKGLLYAKDMLALLKTGESKPISEVMRKAFFVPESKRCDVLLKELQTSKIHMAVVVDEYGGTAGLVTIEDLIEEIVGDIQDEYDIHEEADYIQEGPDTYLVDASMNLDDFNELLNVELPTDESDTLGGFLFTTLGHVPEAGETLEHLNLTLKIEAIEGRRIRKVRVTRRAPAADADGESPSETDGSRVQPQTVTD